MMYTMLSLVNHIYYALYYMYYSTIVIAVANGAIPPLIIKRIA